MKPGPTSTSSRRRRICCLAAVIFVVVTAAVLTTLWFTLFKPKEPELTVRPVGLENIEFSLTPNATMNVTIDMVITIDNKRNYGSFKFESTTAYVNYRGDEVAEVPIGRNLVPARGDLNITSSTDLMVRKVLLNPSFYEDFLSGSLNLTSEATLHGKVSSFKILKMTATAFSSCEISFFVTTREIHSKCKSKIKL